MICANLLRSFREFGVSCKFLQMNCSLDSKAEHRRLSKICGRLDYEAFFQPSFSENRITFATTLIHANRTKTFP